MEVLLYHGLQQLKVVSAELADALVKSVSNLRISITLSCEYLVNVILAFLHV